MHDNDTIAAIATPAGRGGVGMIRISGTEAADIAFHVTGVRPRPRYAHFARFHDADGQVLDEGLLLFFPSPHSFTGEDVAELHAHGSPVALDLLMQRVTGLGARVADPGEFSRRAFCNNKRDLAQIEAVADLIASSAAQAARSAQRVLQGEFSARIDTLRAALVELRARIESSLDFPDDLVDDMEITGMREKLHDIHKQVSELLERGQQGALLATGAEVAIVGRPNVGKSSMLNRLAQRDEAIVSDVPGTTRDVLKCDLVIRGLPVRVADTAGMRQPSGAIEAEGIRRARDVMQQADLVLIMLDATQTCYSEERAWANDLDRSSVKWLAVLNKVDLLAAGMSEGVRRAGEQMKGPAVGVSAKTGEGLDSLITRIPQGLGYDETADNALSARRRHMAALATARNALDAALRRLGTEETELLAEELREAGRALGEIVGATTTEDLLGEIFSRFCIGK